MNIPVWLKTKHQPASQWADFLGRCPLVLFSTQRSYKATKNGANIQYFILKKTTLQLTSHILIKLIRHIWRTIWKPIFVHGVGSEHSWKILVFRKNSNVLNLQSLALWQTGCCHQLANQLSAFHFSNQDGTLRDFNITLPGFPFCQHPTKIVVKFGSDSPGGIDYSMRILTKMLLKVLLPFDLEMEQ